MENIRKYDFYDRYIIYHIVCIMIILNMYLFIKSKCVWLINNTRHENLQIILNMIKILVLPRFQLHIR